MSKRCRVVCDTVAGIRECELELPDDASIAVALERARPLLGEQAADWESAATGVFGVLRERAFVPGEGDRIEIYRALLIDPRGARRERAAQAASGLRRRVVRAPVRRDC